MNRDDVLQIIREARNRDEAPYPAKANLREADLHGADLHEADLHGADLRGAYLNGADLHGANLHVADLRWADLREANLRNADLHMADLRVANLRNANLTNTDLHSANLFRGLWDGLAVDGLHRYRCLLVPTPQHWQVIIGCWTGTNAELRALIAGDDWPESTGDEISRLRPALASFCDMCDAHIATHPGVIDDLAARWSE